jgi:tRNA(Ile)-lysidine synthase
MSGDPFEAARASGLIRAGAPLLVLISGGGDSVCLLDVAVRLGASVSALHVNYGLREGADADEAFVRELSGRLGVPLQVERVRLPESGNLQERAREARYALAERLTRGDYAAAHTASDQAETVLYRLAVSPGSRALHGMAPRRGRLVRPLLDVTREEVRDYLAERGLEWREDPSNADRRFARARVRHDLLGALREIGPAPERTIAATAAQLREEAELLERAVDAALDDLGGGPAVSISALREQPPALRRLVMRRLAGDRPVPDEVLELDERGSSSLDLGEGLRAVAEYGTLRFTTAGEPREPEPVELPVPGRARFGGWELEAAPAEEGDVSLSAAALGDSAIVRAWRAGDRMRPLGVGGTKSLQDLFTDRKIPRALRRTLPVVEVRGEVAWVAGVALDERFAARAGEPSVGLSARAR